MESGKETTVAKEAKKAKKSKSRKTRATCIENVSHVLPFQIRR